MNQPTDLPAEFATIRASLNNWLIPDSVALAALDRLAAREGEKPWIGMDLGSGGKTVTFEVPAATDAGASALEAQKRACGTCGGRLFPIEGTDAAICPGCAIDRDFTPLAPPAAECAVRLALERIAEGAEIEYWKLRNWLDTQPDLRDWIRGDDGPAYPFMQMRKNALHALATPCQHASEQSEIARLRGELENWKEEFSTDNPELAKLESTNFGASEMLRVIMDLESPGVIGDPKAQIIREMLKGVDGLRAELAQARKATEEAQKWAHDFESSWNLAVRDKYELAAELRRAVDALRSAAEFLHAAQNNYTVNWAVVEQIDEAIAAYDAKHGEQS